MAYTFDGVSGEEGEVSSLKWVVVGEVGWSALWLRLTSQRRVVHLYISTTPVSKYVYVGLSVTIFLCTQKAAGLAWSATASDCHTCEWSNSRRSTSARDMNRCRLVAGRENPALPNLSRNFHNPAEKSLSRPLTSLDRWLCRGKRESHSCICDLRETKMWFCRSCSCDSQVYVWRHSVEAWLTTSPPKVKQYKENSHFLQTVGPIWKLSA